MERSTPAPPWPAFRRPAGEPARRFAEPVRKRRGPLLLAAALAWRPASADAQVAANLSLQSSQQFRGETISDGDPGLSLAVSYDSTSGLFAGADISLAAGDGDPRMTGSNQYLGYALRKGEVSIEAGAVHRDYGRIEDEAYNKDFTEVFVGVSYRKLRLRAYVSPDYLVDGRTTYYLECEARLATVGGWHLDGHGGVSLIPRDPGDPRGGVQDYEDWSLRIGRPLGKFEIGMSIAATNYPVFGPSGKVRFMAAVSRSF